MLHLFLLFKCDDHLLFRPLLLAQSEMIIRQMSGDFEIGFTIHETIIPQALLWFTGEAVEDDSDYFEEEEDEEELEEEEEGWGDREFVSDMSGDEDGLSDLEDAVVRYFCALLARPAC